MSRRILSCPSCRAQMVVSRLPGLHGVDVDHCPECLGMYFDARELARELGAPVPPMQEQGDSERRCPLCGGGFRLALMSKVEIDWCATCHGVYLDAGEYNRLRKGRAPRRTRKRRMISEDDEDWIPAVLFGVVVPERRRRPRRR